ncbi:MAG: L,D-transpeptidase family protein [Nocardioidaceae bacterium]
MTKLMAIMSAAVVAVGVTAAVPGSTATAQPANRPATNVARAAGGAQAATPAARAHHRFRTTQRWAREVTRYGDTDTSPWHIEHVRELQYRLAFAGVYHAGAVGHFGPKTRRGVRRYQRREGLRVTGVANHKTWAHLLRDTVRHRGQTPHVCKTGGWHACYDRKMNQLTLWHSGHIVNTWLVRGGAHNMQTRRGTHWVYWRDIDHRSRTYGGSPMPYSQFFDGGEAIHGSRYMMNPFVGHSHGCVNMYVEDARQLWKLTAGHHRRLKVTVYAQWS